MNIGPETRKKMDEYDSLQKIVDQLERHNYQSEDRIHHMKNNVAFMKLKEMAKEPFPVFKTINLRPLIVLGGEINVSKVDECVTDHLYNLIISHLEK